MRVLDIPKLAIGLGGGIKEGVAGLGLAKAELQEGAVLLHGEGLARVLRAGETLCTTKWP